MKILKNRKVPTGNILVVQGEHGPLECLSVGDYGKEKNLKADFLGLDKEIEGVPHGELLPLEDKWVITISSQYGCSMGCSFCDCPKVGPGRNATDKDLVAQVLTCIRLHPEVQETNRLNVHFARMGEPTFNESVIYAAKELRSICNCLNFKFHPVISTMMPIGMHGHGRYRFIDDWLNFKNMDMEGEAGLQISINTTSDLHRYGQFNNNSMDLEGISKFYKDILELRVIRGRKIALNFALTDAPIDAQKLRELFDPRVFLCKITPMHMTSACQENNLETIDGYTKFYPYQKVEKELKEAGFDVIVFIPSKEEDESKITCGNAILAEKL